MTLKQGIQTIKKGDLHYRIDGAGRLQTYTPWLGDAFSILYDWMMERSVIPKKLGADIERHYTILRAALQGVHGARVLELGTGSGSAVHFLANDNTYTGIDISPRLLRRASKRLRSAGFNGAALYVTPARDLPFADDDFGACLCVLSLNFFEEARQVFQEVSRVLVPGGMLVGSVPVPERNRRHSVIRGTLYGEEALAALCEKAGLRFASLPDENGTLLYFKAVVV